MNQQSSSYKTQEGASLRTKMLVKTGLLSVLAFLLMMIEMPIPIFPAFLKIDLGDIPAILGAFALGPAVGIYVELIKNLLHLVTGLSSTGGVGEIANFIIGSALVVPAGLVYKQHKGKKYALLGLLAGTVCMVIVGALVNLYVMLPFYAKIMPVDIIIKMSAAANARIVDFPTLVLYGITPFNIFKGLVLSIVTLLIYKRISPILHR